MIMRDTDFHSMKQGFNIGVGCSLFFVLVTAMVVFLCSCSPDTYNENLLRYEDSGVYWDGEEWEVIRADGNGILDVHENDTIPDYKDDWLFIDDSHIDYGINAPTPQKPLEVKRTIDLDNTLYYSNGGYYSIEIVQDTSIFEGWRVDKKPAPFGKGLYLTQGAYWVNDTTITNRIKIVKQ